MRGMEIKSLITFVAGIQIRPVILKTAKKNLTRVAWRNYWFLDDELNIKHWKESPVLYVCWVYGACGIRLDERWKPVPLKDVIQNEN